MTHTTTEYPVLGLIVDRANPSFDYRDSKCWSVRRWDTFAFVNHSSYLKHLEECEVVAVPEVFL